MTVSSLRPGFVELDQYLTLPRDAQTWLLKPLIPTSGAALLYGDAKLGKTYLGIQLALAISGQMPDFLGFPVQRTGPVLMLQLDTPRSVFANRFEDLIKRHKIKYDSKMFLIADRESLDYYPLDFLNPGHVAYMQELIRVHNPVAVVIDTLREAHSGDEDKSTSSRNVIANLVAATHPAALILISHGRKPNPEGHQDLLADHRGSNYIVGRMDAIIRLTKRKLHYTGRSIEPGDITLNRADSGLWVPAKDDIITAAKQVILDGSLGTLRQKAKELAKRAGVGEDAALSRLRRMVASGTAEGLVKVGDDMVDAETGEVLAKAPAADK